MAQGKPKSRGKRQPQKVVRGHWIVLTKGVAMVAGALWAWTYFTTVRPESATDVVETLSVAHLMWIVLTAATLYAAVEIIMALLWLATSRLEIYGDHLVWRTGLIFRTRQRRLYERLESTDVDDTLLGGWLGYGNLRIIGIGSNELVLPNITKPHDLDNFVNSKIREAHRRAAPQQGRGGQQPVSTQDTGNSGAGTNESDDNKKHLT